MSELTHRIKPDEKAKQPDSEVEKKVTQNPIETSCTVFVKILLSLVIAVVLLITVLPSPISPTSVILSPAVPPLTSDLTKIVKSSQKINLPGCESIALDSRGYLYTGTYHGLVVQVSPDFSDVTPLVRTGPAPVDDEKCNNSSLADDLNLCGRVLGVRLLDEDTLIVIDHLHGIFSISIKHKSKTLLLDLKNQPSYLDIPIHLPNNLIILPTGDSILFTDSFTKFTQKQAMLALLEHGTDGRVYKLDLISRNITLFLSGIHFPNGIELHRDGESILIAELSICRIIRYYFRGNKQGTKEVFSDNFIGIPDNIQRARAGGYWVGVPLVRNSVFDTMMKYPTISSVVTKLIDAELLEKLSITSTGEGLAVRLGEEGEVLEYVYDPLGSHAPLVTEAVDSENGFLYFATISGDNVARTPYPIQ